MVAPNDDADFGGLAQRFNEIGIIESDLNKQGWQEFFNQNKALAVMDTPTHRIVAIVPRFKLVNPLGI